MTCCPKIGPFELEFSTYDPVIGTGEFHEAAEVQQGADGLGLDASGRWCSGGGSLPQAGISEATIRYLERGGAEFLTFTHRATAVTIQGTRLTIILRAIMRHTLMEINAPDGRALPEGDELPTIERIAITYPNELPPAAT